MTKLKKEIEKILDIFDPEDYDIRDEYVEKLSALIDNHTKKVRKEKDLGLLRFLGTTLKMGDERRYVSNRNEQFTKGFRAGYNLQRKRVKEHINDTFIAKLNQNYD